MPLVLLDTNAAAGLLSGISITANGEENKLATEWQKCIKDLTSVIGDVLITIPTPVFPELAAKNDGMYKALMSIVNSKTVPSKLFQYIKRSIPTNIMFIGSKYRVECGKRKIVIEFVDSLIAAYSLIFGHYVITTNGKDFPDAFFEVMKVCVIPKKTPKQERIVVYLLKPSLSEWASCNSIKGE